MTIQIDRAGNILDAVYRSILNVSSWADVMAQTLAAVGGVGGAVVHFDRMTDEVTCLYDAGLSDRAQISDLKQQLSLFSGAPRRGAVSCELPAANGLGTSAPLTVECLRIFSDDTRQIYLALGVDPDTSIRETAELLQFLKPHFERSIALALELDAAKTIAALDQLAVASAIIDHKGVPAFANRRMSEISDKGDGIVLTRTGIACAARRDNAALQAAVRKQLEFARANGRDRSVLTIGRPSGRRSYSAVVSRIMKTARLVPPPAQVIVGIVDPDTTHTFKPEVLRDLFGLTRSEAALCSALVETGNLANAAACCALTAGSARQYMKRIFAKTETSGQVDFVARVVSSVYGLQL